LWISSFPSTIVGKSALSQVKDLGTFVKKINWPAGMVAHTYDSNMQEAESRRITV
jgi:hypothetical protein